MLPEARRVRTIHVFGQGRAYVCGGGVVDDLETSVSSFVPFYGFRRRSNRWNRLRAIDDVPCSGDDKGRSTGGLEGRIILPIQYGDDAPFAGVGGLIVVLTSGGGAGGGCSGRAVACHFDRGI